jgi:hypothetical protein
MHRMIASRIENVDPGRFMRHRMKVTTNTVNDCRASVRVITAPFARTGCDRPATLFSMNCSIDASISMVASFMVVRSPGS